MGSRWQAIRRGTGDLPPVVDGLHTAIDAQHPESLTLVSGKVSVAGDLSGRGLSWSQGTDALRPLYAASVAGLGGRPGFVFDGATTFLSGSSLAALTAGEMLLVVSIAADPPLVAAKTGIARLGSVASETHFPFTDSIIYDCFGTTARKTVGDPATALTGNNCYQVYSASADWQAFLNGASLVSTGTNTVGFHATPRLGAGTVVFLDGAIGCFYLWNRKLTTAERAQCLAWSRYRWGTP